MIVLMKAFVLTCIDVAKQHNKHVAMVIKKSCIVVLESRQLCCRIHFVTDGCVAAHSGAFKASKQVAGDGMHRF